MKEVYAFLKIHGKTIGEKSSTQYPNNLCLKICKVYQMHLDSPKDNAVQGVLRTLIKEYKQKEKL